MCTYSFTIQNVVEMDQRGVSATVACDKGYKACINSLPLTGILHKLRADAHSVNWPEVLLVRAE